MVWAPNTSAWASSPLAHATASSLAAALLPFSFFFLKKTVLSFRVGVQLPRRISSINFQLVDMSTTTLQHGGAGWPPQRIGRTCAKGQNCSTKTLAIDLAIDWLSSGGSKSLNLNPSRAVGELRAPRASPPRDPSWLCLFPTHNTAVMLCTICLDENRAALGWLAQPVGVQPARVGFSES